MTVMIFSLLLAAFLICRWIWGSEWLRAKRQFVAGRAIPQHWQPIIAKSVPHYGFMPTMLRQQLERHIQVFLAEKQFIGCDGLQITEEMRVTIAAQACLLIINRPINGFDELRWILLYPTRFIAKRVEHGPAGIVSEHHQVLAGESWSSGKIVLSWADVQASVNNPNTAHNVVIHEFTHQLDHLDDHSNGAPDLPSAAAYQAWSNAFSQGFAELHEHIHAGIPTLIDHYGAENPAEFFAVVTETFFTQPQALQSRHPALYTQLADYFRVDPAAWLPPAQEPFFWDSAPEGYSTNWHNTNAPHNTPSTFEHTINQLTGVWTNP